MQRIVLRHVSDATSNLVGFRENIVPGHADGAGGGGKITGHDAHDRAFARTVRAEESNDLSPFHVEGNIGHSSMAAVPLGQVFDFNHHPVAHEPKPDFSHEKGFQTTKS